MINFSKSSIQFGHKVDNSIRDDPMTIFGITTNIEGLGGSKTKIFSFVKERLHDIINGWSAKFLSKGGKEVMIKSVTAAMLSYEMAITKIGNIKT